MQNIPFTQTVYSPTEIDCVTQALAGGKLEGDGPWTKKSESFLQERFKVHRALFTTSCTDALELAALLCDLKAGDEVIVPSYTFTSTAHAFALRGAKIVFVDSRPDHPNLDFAEVVKLVTPRTRAIVPVHYAGVPCEMDKLMSLAAHHRLLIVCDAAQAVDSRYQDRPVAQWGHMSAFSFHQTKNITCGEGGLLTLPDLQFSDRAEIIREKGTNRAAFFRGQTDKYTCVDIGSSFLGSDLNASLLWGQLQNIDTIQSKRMQVWQTYRDELKSLPANIRQPTLPSQTQHNAHCYYLVMPTLEARQKFIGEMKAAGIATPFHYISLHHSPYYSSHHDGRKLPHSDRYTDCLVRLPLFSGLLPEQQAFIIENIKRISLALS